MSRALSPTELHSHISFLTLDKNSLRARRLFDQSPDRESIPGPPSYQDGALPLSYRGNEIRLYQQIIKRQNPWSRLCSTSPSQYLAVLLSPFFGFRPALFRLLATLCWVETTVGSPARTRRFRRTTVQSKIEFAACDHSLFQCIFLFC